MEESLKDSTSISRPRPSRLELSIIPCKESVAVVQKKLEVPTSESTPHGGIITSVMVITSSTRVLTKRYSQSPELIKK